MTLLRENNFPEYMQHGVVTCPEGHRFMNCGPEMPQPEDCRNCKREEFNQVERDRRNERLEAKAKAKAEAKLKKGRLSK